MLKRFTHIFAYLLLVMMPLQSIAAANMLVCNSVMQNHHSQAQSAETSVMPCHEHVKNVTAHASNKDGHDEHQSNCKSSCGTLCASLCAMTVLPSNLNSIFSTNTSKLTVQAIKTYVSVTLANTQRPPIFLS